MHPAAEELVNEYDALAAAPEMGLHELAILGQEIEALIANLQVVRKTIGNRLNDIMDGRATLEVTGIGVLERTRPSSWRRINEASEVLLVGHVARVMRGVTRSPSAAAANTALALRDLASLSWRVTQLRAIGVDPTKYLDQQHGDWAVRIPKIQ